MNEEQSEKLLNILQNINESLNKENNIKINERYKLFYEFITNDLFKILNNEQKKEVIRLDKLSIETTKEYYKKNRVV